MGKTNSLWKAIVFPLLIIIAVAALQCGLLVWLEGFNKLTVAIALAGTILAGYVSMLFYTSKKMWINLLWIVLLSLILDVAGIMFGDAIYLSMNVENLSVWGATLQILCAIFSPENVSDIFDKQQFINGVNSDLASAILYVSIGVGIAIVAFIAFYIRAVKTANQSNTKTTEQSKQNYQTEKQVDAYTHFTGTSKPVDNKQIIVDIAKCIQNYSKTGNKEQLKSQLSNYYNEKIANLTTSQKADLKSFAQRNLGVSNQFIAKACVYVLKRIQ